MKQDESSEAYSIAETSIVALIAVEADTVLAARVGLVTRIAAGYGEASYCTVAEVGAETNAQVPFEFYWYPQLIGFAGIAGVDQDTADLLVVALDS